jgi:uncharacterized protein
MQKMTRRTFLRLAAGSSLSMGVSALVAVYGFRVEPARLSIERVAVRSPRVPPELNGLTIGLLSDLHRGRNASEAFIARAAQTLQALAPDLIALTGDFVYGPGNAESVARILQQNLRAALGIFAVLGNHDLPFTGNPEPGVAAALHAAFAGRDFTLLRNSRHTLTVRGVPLHVAGVDDVRRGNPDLAPIVNDLPRDEAAILLAHEPDYADIAAARHPFILQLSGHSHGGQVRLPIIGAPILPKLGRKYPIGLNHVDGMFVYTSRGIGVMPPAVRFNCPPEVTLLKFGRS